MLRQTLPTPAVRQLVSRCFRRYPNGFIANVQDGDVPARYHSLATYLAKYVVTPPISGRYIDRYDGRRVTDHYRSHRTERVERETVDVHRFIGRMVQHGIKGAIKIIAPMTYRQRYQQSTGRDPLRCLHCSGEMVLWRIWHPIYGVIYDEAKAIKRGQYEQRRERDSTARGHRHPLWAPA